ncbi:MAG: hypothetical protein ACR2JE_05260 [Acidobacteriaceae bacterium]
MAWITLFIGAVLFLGGVFGQVFGMRQRGQSARDQRRAGLFTLRIVAVIIGAWLLIFGISHALRGHGTVRPSDTQGVR